jgi:hypothetical protein
MENFQLEKKFAKKWYSLCKIMKVMAQSTPEKNTIKEIMLQMII